MQGTAPVPEHVMAKVMFKEMLESVSVVSVTERQRQWKKQIMPKLDKMSTMPEHFNY